MTETVSIEATLPVLSAKVAAIDFSGCCAIFEGGTFLGNGALIWTGMHIVTAANVVSSAVASNLTFEFDTALTYTAVTASSITLHPEYAIVADHVENNIAIITLSNEASLVLSRYIPELLPNKVGVSFLRRAYGEILDPNTGLGATGSSESRWISSRNTAAIGEIFSAYDTSNKAVYDVVTIDESGKTSVIITRYNQSGSINWKKKLEAPSNYNLSCKAYCLASSGDLFFAGSYTDTLAGSVYGWAASITNAGVINWSKYFSASFNLEFSSVHLSTYAAYVHLAALVDDSGVRKVILVRLSSAGSLLNKSYYASPGGTNVKIITASDPNISSDGFSIVTDRTDPSNSSRKLLQYVGWNGAWLYNSPKHAASASGYSLVPVALTQVNKPVTGVYRLFLSHQINVSNGATVVLLHNDQPGLTPYWQFYVAQAYTSEALAITGDGVSGYTLLKCSGNGLATVNLLLIKFSSATGAVEWQVFIRSGYDFDTGFLQSTTTSVTIATTKVIGGNKYPVTMVIDAATGSVGTYSEYSIVSADATLAAASALSWITSGNSVSNGTVTGFYAQDATISVTSATITYTLTSIQVYQDSGARQFYTADNLYELSGGASLSLQKPTGDFEANKHLVYDYDDGTSLRDAATGSLTTSSEATWAANSAFVSNDTRGAVSFSKDGLLIGLHSLTFTNSKSITANPGCYGSIAYDYVLAMAISFLESAAATPPNTLGTEYRNSNFSSGTNGNVADTYAAYSEDIGPYIKKSGVYSSSLYLSQDHGAVWTQLSLPLYYSSGEGRYASLNTIARFDGRYILAGSQAIWYSDDGYSWTKALDVISLTTSGFVSDWPILKHPITGVIVVAGTGPTAEGLLHTSQDNGATWTTVTPGSAAPCRCFYLPKFSSFVGVSLYNVFSSNTGNTWIKRKTLAVQVNPYVVQNNVYYKAGVWTSVTLDGGVNWADIDYIVDKVFFANGLYFAYSDVTQFGTPFEGLVFSADGLSFVPVRNADLLFNYDRKPIQIVGGNGYIVALCDADIKLFVSLDNGKTWTANHSIDEPLGYNPHLEYNSVSDTWFAAYQTGFYYAADPSRAWTKITIPNENNFKWITLTAGSTLLSGQSSVYYLPTIAVGAEITYNYASKVLPISGSGLVGVVAGSTHFSGTLLQTGKDILTSAHAVVGITDYASVQIIFNVDAAITIPAPLVISITSHPSYNVTPGTSGWINYDLAIIHLQDPVDARVSRYELYSGDEAIPVVFDKTGYGHAWDPVSGVAEVDNLHFIAFQNRYESLGLPLQGLGISYIASDLHLLYDYDDGTSTHDAIGGSSGFINQPSNTGLGANEGFTAPGRSGSAGLLGGKIAGVTFGTYTIPGGFDINGTASDATYGEVGIDMRISMFSSWIGDTALFGVDVEGSLPGFSSGSELWFTQPTGLVVEGSLSGLTALLVAAQPNQFGIGQLLPGLSPDIIVTIPWQMEATVFGLTSDFLLEKAPAIAVDGELLAFTSSFDITAVGAFDWEARLPALAPDQQLELAALFAAQSTLSLSGGVDLQPAYDVSLSGILPVLVSDFLVKSDFEVVALLPSLTSELDLIYRSIEFTARLPELTGDMSLEGYTFNVDSKLLALQGDFQWAHNEMAIDATMPALLGGMKFHATSDVVFEATLPDLTFEGLWQGMELADVMPGLRGGMKVIDANSCTTRYL